MYSCCVLEGGQGVHRETEKQVGMCKLVSRYVRGRIVHVLLYLYSSP